MKTLPTTRLALTTVVLATALACHAGCEMESNPLDGLPEPTPMGEHLRLYTEEGNLENLCGGSLPYMDRYLHELIIQTDADLDHVVDYYWFPDDPDRIASLCPQSGACAYPEATIITPSVPDEHELVHGVLADLGRHHRLFGEGLAELWGAHTPKEYDLSRSIHDAIEAGPYVLPFPDYGVAGSFTAFLGFEFGTETLVDLLPRVPRGSTPTEVDAAFLSVVGLNTAELIGAYEDADWRCQREDFRDDTVNCAVARQLDCADADANGDVQLQIDLDCTSDQFVGPRDGIVWTEIAVPIGSRPSSLTLTTEEGALESFTLRWCGGGCDDPTTPFRFPTNQEYQLLGAYEGLNLVRIELPDDGVPRGMATLTAHNICTVPG